MRDRELVVRLVLLETLVKADEPYSFHGTWITGYELTARVAAQIVRKLDEEEASQKRLLGKKE